MSVQELKGWQLQHCIAISVCELHSKPLTCVPVLKWRKSVCVCVCVRGGGVRERE